MIFFRIEWHINYIIISYLDLFRQNGLVNIHRASLLTKNIAN